LTDTKPTIPTWLTYLLAERRELCALLQERQRVKLIADLKAVRAVEDRIRELALDPLHLCGADAPNPALIVDVITALSSRFNSLPFDQRPELVFRTSVVPGFSLNLTTELQERLLVLCGCLDNVISKKLYLDSEESAA
jgi:hypothetical protein